MDEMVAAIRHVSDLVGEISAASKEQSQGVGQVSEAIAQMDQTTQQNAALVEQSAAAAEGLKRQAKDLVEAVASFKTKVTLSSMASAHTAVVRSRNVTTAELAPTAIPSAAVPHVAKTKKAAPIAAIARSTATAQSAEADWESF